jgi:HlyD family secretion protein
LRAPADGTITAVDVKLGELVTAQKPVITLQDVSSVYIEANINESDITRVALGQKVMVTFDAFGPEQVFPATISSIDPSSTTVSGVVNYKIKATLDDSTQVLPGMTANMTITTGEKADVVFIPKAALRGDPGTGTHRKHCDPVFAIDHFTRSGRSNRESQKAADLRIHRCSADAPHQSSLERSGPRIQSGHH